MRLLLICAGAGEAEGAKYSAAIISRNINLYSSPDLATWKFEGAILTGDQIKGMPFPAPFRIERPKARRRPACLPMLIGSAASRPPAEVRTMIELEMRPTPSFYR